VYIWGWTRFNQEVSAGFGFIPIKVNFPEKVVIKQISCSSVHSLALTENDRVYIFGDRPSGIEDNQESLTPKRIELNDLISKISCGHYHSLLLSNDGVIYAIGKVFSAESVKISENSDINEIRLKPSKLIHKKKFIDIACHWKEHISIALSSDNIYHVWGESEADNFHIPIETTFESFNEIFIYYCDYDFEISEKLSEFKDLYFRHEYYNRNYIEVKEIGKGSYGKVFKVIDNLGQNENAIKKIIFKKEHKNEILKEFYRFSLVHKLFDKNIVRHNSVWIENSLNENIILYIVMDLCNKTLEQIIDEIRENTDLKKDKILTPIGYYLLSQIFIEILECVQFLHENNIIHRDLNPYNIMLTRDRKIFIRIVDFGLIAIHEFADQTHSSDEGHPDYMAPEVFDGRIYDTKADIYSLGKILGHLFDIDVQKLVFMII
jgi:tRNA A-37 threonylcarbamoyl transferase component Bud32